MKYGDFTFILRINRLFVYIITRLSIRHKTSVKAISVRAIVISLQPLLTFYDQL